MTHKRTLLTSYGCQEMNQLARRGCFSLIACMLIALGSSAHGQFIGFSGLAAVQDNVGPNCNGFGQITGLLPQLNPPAAVISCQDITTANVAFAPGVQTITTAGAYPANGMLSTSALVDALQSGATASATAQISDTYYLGAVPPNTIPAQLVFTIHVGGINNLTCSAGICYSDETQTQITLPGDIVPIDGTGVANCGTACEIFYLNSLAVVVAVGQDLHAFLTLVPGVTQQGTPALIGNFNMSMTSQALCSSFDPESCLAYSEFTDTLRVTHVDVADAAGNIIPGATFTTASEFNPNASQQSTFSSFKGKLDVVAGLPHSFDFTGSFTLGAGSSINPPATGLALTVGNYSVVVPMNTFVKTGKGAFVYQGTINGASLQFQIAPTTTANTYTFKVDESGIGISTVLNPVPVKLVIGKNSGSTQVNAQFQ